jgi:hypothetical protein
MARVADYNPVCGGVKSKLAKILAKFARKHGRPLRLSVKPRRIPGDLVAAVNALDPGALGRFRHENGQSRQFFGSKGAVLPARNGVS